MIVPKDIYSHEAIARIFEGRDLAFPTNKAKLIYSRKCLALCVEQGWVQSSKAWSETVEALEQAVLADLIAFDSA